eukprot:TRINITY_DN28459_c0_g1_i1.p1 TRINITY_DN28459_c0_g1~~TRINITY_DN28459_c0_g1_i1.p1  ORF type:complete len:570 (+),score=155.08 TRINITY_DN28459_c0_g1_i1:26-1711(+)
MSIAPLTHNGFKRDGPVVFIVIDGCGVAKPGKGNCVEEADMKYYKQLIETAKGRHLHTLIKAHGPAVGLPTEADMGNSEVGHNALGCGQVYSQGAKLVNESIKSGDFFKTEKWQETVIAAIKDNKAVHFFGLLSDGNVHSHTEQVFKIIQGTAQSGAKKIYIHPLLDGRDVAPDSGLKYIEQLETVLAEVRKAHPGCDARIATGGGRMTVTMDRYESDWNVVKRGWDAMVRGTIDPSIVPEIKGEYTGYFKSAAEAINLARKMYPKHLDQYNPPFVIVGDDGKAIGKIHDGDAVVNWNFRGDRAVQISKAFVNKTFTFFDRVEFPAVRYAGLLEYDAEIHVPPVFLVPPPTIKNVSSEYICASGVTCYALAETHKFGHMTFFWNGNRSGYINSHLETYEEIKSLPNEMTESHPEMKAAEVTTRLLAALESKKFKYLRVNYANPDMVGHTGNIESVLKAMLVIEEQLKIVVPAIEKLGGICMITADHGNAEQMYDKTGALMTSHTTNPVNFFIVDPLYKGEYVIDTTGIPTPGLTNLTASYINMLGFNAPSMYDRSLIKFNL